jgi:hypothetical protein
VERRKGGEIDARRGPGSTSERGEQTLAPVTGGGEETSEGRLSTIARVARFVNRDRSFFFRAIVIEARDHRVFTPGPGCDGSFASFRPKLE